MRHAPDAADGCLRHRRVLIHDRDPLFRPAGRDTLPPADVTPIRRPARAPNLNAYTERFVRTIQDSCLKRMVLIGEGSRRRAVREFVAHYHHERNHQGLDNRLILPLSTAPPPRGRVPCRQRLGGMLTLRLSGSSVIHDRPSTPRSSFWTVRGVTHEPRADDSTVASQEEAGREEHRQRAGRGYRRNTLPDPPRKVWRPSSA